MIAIKLCDILGKVDDCVNYCKQYYDQKMNDKINDKQLNNIYKNNLEKLVSL